MKVLLLQLDGKIPNLALMRIAAHHRERGDEVELRAVSKPDGRLVSAGFFDAFDAVYASLIFDKSKPLAKALLQTYPDAKIGGSGWNLATKLEDAGIDPNIRPDYSLWPSFRQSLGFTQRGCRLSCDFCRVPIMEGKVKPSATIAEIWRGEPWPREVLLLDNDFFGQPEWRERIRELREGRFKVSFNQGINARMLNDETAGAIASVNYHDDGMKTRRIYTAWDNRKDESTLFRGLESLKRAGVNPDNVMVYILIGYWAGETDADWEYRRARLREFGARPYPMPYVRNNLTRGFQRYCVGAYDKRVTWEQFKAARCEPRNMGRQDARTLFPLETVEK